MGIKKKILKFGAILLAIAGLWGNPLQDNSRTRFDNFAGSLEDVIRTQNRYFSYSEEETKNLPDNNIDKIRYFNSRKLFDKSFERLSEDDKIKVNTVKKAVNLENNIGLENLKDSVNLFQENGYMFYINNKAEWHKDYSVYSILFGKIKDIDKDYYRDINNKYEIIKFVPTVTPFNEINSSGREIMFAPKREYGIKKIYINDEELDKEADSFLEVIKFAKNSNKGLHLLYKRGLDQLNKDIGKFPFLFQDRRIKQKYKEYWIKTFGKEHETAHLFLGANELEAHLKTLEKYPEPIVLAEVILDPRDDFYNCLKEKGYNVDDLGDYFKEDILKLVKDIRPKFSTLFDLLVDYKIFKENNGKDNTNELKEFLSDNYPEVINEEEIDFIKLEDICEEHNKFCMLINHRIPESINDEDKKLLMLGDLKKIKVEYELRGEKIKDEFIVFSNVPFISPKEFNDFSSWYDPNTGIIYINESKIRKSVENQYNSVKFIQLKQNPSYSDRLVLELYNIHPKQEDFIENLVIQVIKKSFIHEFTHKHGKEYNTEFDALIEEMDPKYNALEFLVLEYGSRFADKSRYFKEYQDTQHVIFDLIKENYGLEEESDIKNFIINISSEERYNLIRDN